jgi:hypothetical protein
MQEKQEIHAIHSEDRDALLERLGLHADFHSGLLTCRDCERPVRDQGLGAVQMRDGEIEVACADTSCPDDQVREA